MQFQNLWFSISLLLVNFSCTNTEYIDVTIEIPVNDSIFIKVVKDQTGYYGASGFINNTYKEYQGCDFIQNTVDTSNFYIQIGHFVWFGNTIWAHREVISLNKIPYPIKVNDTIQLISNQKTKYGRIYHLYEDGDVLAECYVILDNNKSKSWFIITEYHENTGEIAGTIHADFVISNICPPKYNPNQPDTIRIRDFWFRAKHRD